MEAGHLPGAYLAPHTDSVREQLEARWLARVAGQLLPPSGGRVLDLGCGGGLGPLLAPASLSGYTGVDFRTPDFALPGRLELHDLREGLGPVGEEPFDLYLAGFGLASHLAPAELRRLLGDIARHARPGSLVAVEALGLYSLEWPQIWERPPGEARLLPYALDHDVEVHPWGPGEMRRLLASAGIRPVQVLDRSLQAGPKLGDSRYWPGLPALRPALVDLLGGHPAGPALTAALPPLPAGSAAAVHQRLAGARRALVGSDTASSAALARRIWALEQHSAGGFGHGLFAIGRVT